MTEWDILKERRHKTPFSHVYAYVEALVAEGDKLQDTIKIRDTTIKNVYAEMNHYKRLNETNEINIKGLQVLLRKRDEKLETMSIMIDMWRVQDKALLLENMEKMLDNE